VIRVVFAGTPEYAEGILQRLLDSTYPVVAVYTQPDRPSGRGQQMKAPPVKALALQRQIPVDQPENFQDETVLQTLRDLQADIMVVTAYGLILPKSVLAIFPHGAINIHPSLLPRWRGATPIQSALLAGDEHTGVTIMQMTAKMDAGPILYQDSLHIQQDENSQQLHQRLMALGSEALIKTLDLIALEKLHPILQDDTAATYTHKIRKEDAKMDWRNPASKLAQMVRAFNPSPVAFTGFQGNILRIWQADSIPDESVFPPGTLLEVHKNYLAVATGSGILRLKTLQLPGKQPISAANFINAQAKNLVPGKTRFDKENHE
jgi:methionyl-tRNA formyltransferase